MFHLFSPLQGNAQLPRRRPASYMCAVSIHPSMRVVAHQHVSLPRNFLQAFSFWPTLQPYTFWGSAVPAAEVPATLAASNAPFANLAPTPCLGQAGQSSTSAAVTSGAEGTAMAGGAAQAAGAACLFSPRSTSKGLPRAPTSNSPWLHRCMRGSSAACKTMPVNRLHSPCGDSSQIRRADGIARSTGWQITARQGMLGHPRLGAGPVPGAGRSASRADKWTAPPEHGLQHEHVEVRTVRWIAAWTNSYAKREPR